MNELYEVTFRVWNVYEQKYESRKIFVYGEHKGYVSAVTTRRYPIAEIEEIRKV